VTTPATTYPSWAEARGAWIADKATPHRYRFPCLGCGRAVEATADEMPRAAERAGLCAGCSAAEEAKY